MSPARYAADARNQLGTRWRKPAPGAQAVIVLAVLRHDQRLADMAGGSHVSASIVRRWALEVLPPLSARAPQLDRALKKTARSGRVVVLLDGTLVRTRRCIGPANAPWSRVQRRGPHDFGPNRQGACVVSMVRRRNS
ncbi:hypothetical protein ACWD5R_37950 [Streptomyces sp. NPDC002514]|uniref:hypothetical protein n=1 Tax=unclassified Streptomyces TaxID=2593676 RepID=UPI0036BD7894